MRFRFGSIPAAQRRVNETPETDRRAGFVNSARGQIAETGQGVQAGTHGRDRALYVGEGALGLRTPEAAGGNLDFTQAVVFDAEGHVEIPLRNKSTQVRR